MYDSLSNKQVVGLLWADQNMKNFGDQHRLLTSAERQTLWTMVTQSPNDYAASPYYTDLSIMEAAYIDKVNL